MTTFDKICSKRCGQPLNCKLEVWFSPMFACTPEDFQGDECVTDSFTAARSIVPEDYRKGSYDSSVGPAKAVTRTTCGSRTILYAMSTVNGLLTCAESHNDGPEINWEVAFNKTTAVETSYTHLTGVKFGRQPQWNKFDENSAMQQKQVNSATRL